MNKVKKALEERNEQLSEIIKNGNCNKDVIEELSKSVDLITKIDEISVRSKKNDLEKERLKLEKEKFLEETLVNKKKFELEEMKLRNEYELGKYKISNDRDIAEIKNDNDIKVQKCKMELEERIENMKQINNKKIERNKLILSIIPSVATVVVNLAVLKVTNRQFEISIASEAMDNIEPRRAVEAAKYCKNLLKR